ncbi:MAG: class I SAM-dependent methyltransferase [Elusimicrobia bacterium]|nr:class I SAM-dependent methyltransferase [Elusimicrobiota bacterium]
MPSKAELEIAGFYDGIYLFYGAANSFLTLGLDRWWRARAAAAAGRSIPEARTALDVCCGTGDFLLALGKTFGPGLELTGADLSAAMLSAAETRLPGVKLIRTAAGELPFPDGSFDLVTLSFAARNLFLDKEHLLAALREFRRVLRPGGVFLNLETTRPAAPAVWFLMRAYVKAVIGLLNLLSPKSSPSYSFLKSTILDFYTAGEFSALLTEAGFARPSHTALFPGAVAVHTARR